MPPRVQAWKNALLDLTLRNRLINFSSRTSIALSVPDGLLATLENIVNEGKLVSLRPRDVIDAVHAERGLTSGWDLPPEHRESLLVSRGQVFCDVQAEGYPTRMRNLAYKARTIVEESGANNLYLALGSLLWTLDSRSLQSPLILVPIQLRPASRGGLYRISLDETGASVPNFCLLEKLRQVHGLEIPELAEPVEDGAGIDLDAALHAVRLAIAKAGLPARVEETAHLAILQFAKFRLWKDLDDNWQTFSGNALVRHLIETPTQAFAQHVPPTQQADLDELAASCPVAADASQLEAVADAVAGRTFVLEGPPGTGKSQTITNLLTRAMVEGRRVLFVAEKRAALDVVRKRLEDVGMGTFSLDLHDKGSKPAVVRSQIRQALDAQVHLDSQGLAAEQQRLRGARQTLARYAGAVHAPNGAGLSYYSAHTSRLALHDVRGDLPVPDHLVGPAGRPELIEQVRRALRDLPDTADIARPRTLHPWGFVGPLDEHRVDVERLRAAVRAVDAAVAAVTPHHPAHQVLSACRTSQDLALVAAMVCGRSVELWVLDEVRNRFWQPAADEAVQRVRWFAAGRHPGMDTATPGVLWMPVAELHEQAKAAAASGFFGRRKRLRAVLEQIQTALRPGVEVRPKDVPALFAALLATQQAAQALREQVARIPGIVLAPDWNPLLPGHADGVAGQVGWLRWASDCVTPGSDHAIAPRLRAYLAAGLRLSGEDAGVVDSLLRAFTELEEVAAAVPADLSHWAAKDGLLGTWTSTAPERDLHDPQLLDLRRWSAFVAALEPLRRGGLEEARLRLLDGAVRADEAERGFDLGLAHASLSERAAATGLAAFDVEVHERSIGRFISSSRLVRAEQAAALPQAVLGRRSFDSSNESGRIGALRRELSKQRRGLAVRALLAQYGDLITQVMPCVLVSPDSLARFFPAQAGLFDVVVFDEASQIRVADSIGALGRAESVVVVGDSKQMPPTSFGEASLQDVGHDDIDVLDALAIEDEESILSECVQARVPQKWLSWHYRSQDESLIAFSNALYYEDRLSSFPAPGNGAVGPHIDGLGVSLVRVEGKFERTRGKLHRTNLVEAETIVAEVLRRFAASPDTVPSIGIVTFNIQQRTLLEGLLRDCDDDRVVQALESPNEGLFVKNLENVQGDERDVIFFSTAFSVDQHGKLPLNFGPLNREGGERRLNVAVTRARRQVIVFSSFDPAQLRAEETSSRGIKDLRAYLDMAATGPAVLDSLMTRAKRPAVLDRHRESVAQALRDRGFGVTTNVGLSDFKIDLSVAEADAPDRPVLAVLLDGPGWAGRRTVGDRDGLPVEVLSQMLHWPGVERVWLPGWLRDPGSVVDRLAERLGQAAHAPPQGALSLRSEHELLIELEPRIEAGPPDRFAVPAPLRSAQAPTGAVTGLAGARTPELPFQPWVPRPAGSRRVLDDLPAARSAAQVRSVATEIIEHEGPIHAERLAKLVAQSFDLSRVSQDRTHAILQAVGNGSRAANGEPFYWPTSVDPASWTAFRRQPSVLDRPLGHVSLVEIANAMTHLERAAGGMDVEDLLRETNGVFGGSRLTPAVRERLEAALLLRESGGRRRGDQ